MFLLGHVGITLGTAIILNRILTSKIQAPSIQAATNTAGGPADPPSLKMEQNDFAENKSARDSLPIEKTTPAYPMGLTDIFCILIGSMLPDIIDKPVGHFIFAGFFGNNGRIFSHTLLFGLIILIGAILLFIYKRKIWGLALSYGVFMHLMLDSMWAAPYTMLWPLFGLEFPRGDLESSWLMRMIAKLLTTPSAFISELVGLFGVGLFFVLLLASPRFARWLHIRR